MATATEEEWKAEDFPCTLYLSLLPSTLHIPFPTAHLASVARLALSVDAELSPLVRRSFALVTLSQSSSSPQDSSATDKSVLQVNYAATTNRMLRVAVNGIFESLGVVIGVMKDLDVDVLYDPVTEGLEGVQGLEEVKG
ncbi:Pcc1-domain-containing protein [Dothidotthia symphoricarpi CBS 119687]|uniref:Pcc1-domain-containing protein n=1 Tax=Dothidotthia symphoricarpi CBS 119687 TaxID=1392245 RepID=A0A6A6A5P4_9PLEO|nr:Pcc1-domain-containing protein [Dothidotthia symphoricarpi CBS 119687]KAF2126866.1 Pcc1-domain-containing protein [Dothidotthia symphoricarpi CBS 119687]